MLSVAFLNMIHHHIIIDIAGTCRPDIIAYVTSYNARVLPFNTKLVIGMCCCFMNYEVLLNSHDMILHLVGAIPSL